jgi:pimeloyl-ACP methyl ester carboxylesterase
MATTYNPLLPRRGTETPSPVSFIPGPSEHSFTQMFGHNLPAATFLSTTYTTSFPSRVLFLHGVQTPALGLQPLAKSLHTSFPSARFVLVDLWGHGLSSTPVAPHTPSLFHSLIDSMLSELQWNSCHLLGYSFGGSLAVSYIASSASRAGKVESVALVAPAGLWRAESLDAAKLHSSDFSVAKTHVLELLEGGPLIVPSNWQSRVSKGEIVAEKVREWQMQNHKGHTASVIAIVRDGGVFGQEEVFRKAAAAHVPMLAVLGETDDVVLEGDLREVGVETVVVIKGAGHAVVRQEVGQVAKHIAQFWGNL